MVVKAITIYFWYGCSHGGFVGIWVDWNHGFVGSNSVLLVVECFYAAIGLDIAQLVFRCFVSFIWYGDSNGCLVLIATHRGYALMTYLTGSLVFIVLLNAFITYSISFVKSA